MQWCGSMTAMGGMMWMRMPGQSWPGAAISFLGMWAVMMVAMMLPALVPMLAQYRRSLGRQPRLRAALSLTCAAMGYFFVWSAWGAIAYPLGAGLTALQMRQPGLARIAPFGIDLVILAVGALQFTAWKARQLTCCRQAGRVGLRAPSDAGLPAQVRGAWRQGLRMGLKCSRCCAGPTMILLVTGVMDLRAMAVITAGITMERLAPAGQQVARATGAIAVGTALYRMARTTLIS